MIKEWTILISIIIPVFNGENYIRRCLNSVFAQTEKDYEIIAVDDGSVDNSLSVLKEYECENMKVIHTENNGVCHARNIGLKYCCGDYVTFVDVDDELRSDALETLLRLLKTHDADIAAGSKIYLKSDGTVRLPRVDQTKEEVWEGLTPLIKHIENHITGHSVYSKLYKREIIENVRFEEGRKVNEDSFFSFQCFANAKKMVFLDTGIYRYYETPNSASRSKFSDKYFDILYFAERKVELINEKFPELQSYTSDIMMKANIFMLFNLCKTYEKKYRSSEKECLKMVRSLKKQFVPVFSYEKKFLKIVGLGLFPLYKLYSYLRFYKS